jgi:hypothetical protein
LYLSLYLVLIIAIHPYTLLLTPSLHIDPYNTLRETISSPGLLMPTSCHIDINQTIFLVGNNTCASHKNLNLTPPQGFSQVLFLFPSPPEKRGNERGAAVALQRHSGTTLVLHLGWGLAANQSAL